MVWRTLFPKPDQTELPLISCSQTLKLQTHILQQLLQVLLQLVEVSGRDEVLSAFDQAVPGQLYQLMVDEAQGPVGQRADLIRRRGGQQLGQTLLHLSRSLGEGRKERVGDMGG